jgi:hypothetical protein
MKDKLEAEIRVSGINSSNTGDSIIRSLISDNLDDILLRLTNHPFGFYCFRFKLTKYKELRIHIWPENWEDAERDEIGEIHDHIYRIDSTIILGALKNETFDFEINDAGEYKLVEIDYQNSQSPHNITNISGNIEMTGANIYSTGSFYYLNSKIFHRAIPINCPSITVVLTEVVEIDQKPRVLLPRSEESLLAYARGEITNEQRTAAQSYFQTFLEA